MNTKIIAAIVVVLAIGAGFLASRGGSSTSTQTPEGVATSATSASMRSLITSGKSLSCVFSKDTNGAKTSGNIHVSGGNMRGDFQETTSTGASTESHIIIVGGKGYVWSSLSPQGLVIPFDINTTQAAKSAEAGLGYDEQTDFQCAPWTVDNSLLTPPSTVQFVEAQNLFKAAIQQPTPTKKK